MRRRRLFVAAGVLVPALAVLALLAYGFTREPRYIESPIIGRPAPGLALTLFDGQAVALDDLRGKVRVRQLLGVVVPAVSSRGAHARGDVAAAPGAGRGLSRREHAGRGAEPRARAFLAEFGITFSSGRDPDSRIAIDYGVWGLPEAFIVDPAGRITYKHIGTLGQALLLAKLDEARRGVVSTSQGHGDYQSTR